MSVNSEIKQYVVENILPVYSTFDEGHNEKHILEVTQRSFDLYNDIKNEYDLDINMIYIIASYHDIGMKISRENHPFYSSEILTKDENLKKWFNSNQIRTMAEAVADHSTSSGHVPRSIYGKIVSDADKDTNIDVGLLRAWNYSLNHFPNFSYEERIEDLHKVIVQRFGDSSTGGQSLVKFYISSSRNKKFVEEMLLYAHNKKALEIKMSELVK
ncbi:hypothetical protein M9Y10_029056 [Tritrichomonas musculus]|uniref:HD domain-containing protein n=1 Tax=Tritrichomonas musculus TaxID=1915356 RepID=A0ABR2KL13_9EUKA